MDDLLKGLINGISTASKVMEIQNKEFVDKFLSQMELINNGICNNNKDNIDNKIKNNGLILDASSTSLSSSSSSSSDSSIVVDGNGKNNNKISNIPIAFQWLESLLARIRNINADSKQSLDNKGLFYDNIREILISCSIIDQNEVSLIIELLSNCIINKSSHRYGEFYCVIPTTDSSLSLLSTPNKQKVNKKKKGSQQKNAKQQAYKPQVSFVEKDKSKIDDLWRNYYNDEEILCSQLLILKNSLFNADDSCFKIILPKNFITNTTNLSMEEFVSLLYRLLRPGPWSTYSTTWHTQQDSSNQITRGLFLKGCIGNLISLFIVTSVLSTYEISTKKGYPLYHKIETDDYPLIFSHDGFSVYLIWNKLTSEERLLILKKLDFKHISKESKEIESHWIMNDDLKNKDGIELLMLMFTFHLNEIKSDMDLSLNNKISHLLQNSLSEKLSREMLNEFSKKGSDKKHLNNTKSKKQQRQQSKSLDESFSQDQLKTSSLSLSSSRFSSIDENNEVEEIESPQSIIEQLATGSLSIPRPTGRNKANIYINSEKKKSKANNQNQISKKYLKLNEEQQNDAKINDDQDTDDSTIDEENKLQNRGSFSSEPIHSSYSQESEINNSESDIETSITSPLIFKKEEDISLETIKIENDKLSSSNETSSSDKIVENITIPATTESLSSSITLNTAISSSITPLPTTIVENNENDKNQSDDITMRLHRDLLEMAMSLQMIADRRRPWQMAIAEKIKEAVYICFPGAWCDVFGSIASGLAAPCSDVDMVVRGVFNPQRIQILAAHLRNQEWVQNLQAIERTIIPLIRFNTAAIPISFGNRGNLIAVDISFENEAHRGLNTCILVRQLVQRYPPLKPLALVIKQFLVEKGLNDPFVGGLSSYGLVVMITAVIQRFNNSDHLATQKNIQMDNLGYLFIKFLETYSNKEIIQKGIYLIDSRQATMNKSGSLIGTKIPQPFGAIQNNQHLAPLFIQDPLNPFNNIGSSCFGITQVIQAFYDALAAIRLSVGIKPTSDWSILGRVFTTDHHQHVVKLVTQTWCPQELGNNKFGNQANISSNLNKQHKQQSVAIPLELSSSRSNITLKNDGNHAENSTNLIAAAEWASNAHRTLSIVYHQVESGVIVCPVCTLNHRLIASPNCPLHLLVLKPSFIPGTI